MSYINKQEFLKVCQYPNSVKQLLLMDIDNYNPCKECFYSCFDSDPSLDDSTRVEKVKNGENEIVHADIKYFKEMYGVDIVEENDDVTSVVAQIINGEIISSVIK